MRAKQQGKADDEWRYWPPPVFAEIDVTQTGRLASLLTENSEAVFPAVHRSYKFSLMTLGAAAEANGLLCHAGGTSHHPRRRFTLTPDEFA